MSFPRELADLNGRSSGGSPALPETPAGLVAANSPDDSGRLRYVTDGADLQGAAAETGVDILTGAESDLSMVQREDFNGDTYVGDTYNPPHGFLTRPQGWER